MLCDTSRPRFSRIYARRFVLRYNWFSRHQPIHVRRLMLHKNSRPPMLAKAEPRPELKCPFFQTLWSVAYRVRAKMLLNISLHGLAFRRPRFDAPATFQRNLTTIVSRKPCPLRITPTTVCSAREKRPAQCPLFCAPARLFCREQAVVTGPASDAAPRAEVVWTGWAPR